MSDLMLTHYNPNKETYVASDASNLGLGAVFLQRKRWSVKGSISCLEDFAPGRN